jgi:proteasome lid subunit RPN8/RPN11
LSITIPKTQIKEMVAHAREAAPEECCGILFGDRSTVTRSCRVPNVHDEPTRRYTMDPLELVHADREAEARGEEFVAFYHSHPHSVGYPSETDVDNAVESEWVDPFYVVVSLADKAKPTIRAFRISLDRTIDEVPITVANDSTSAGE